MKAGDSWEEGVCTQPAPCPEGPVRQDLQLHPDQQQYFLLTALDCLARLRVESSRKQASISSPSLSLKAFLPDPQAES